MPIYTYKCMTCGCVNDVLQKMNDNPIQKCPDCGSSSYSKQVTAPSFQLKGNGWYVTDFRDSKNNKSEKEQVTKSEKPNDNSSTSDLSNN
ncbi:MAG: zinc ribbon domain-containing protein [Candidatus Kinetoplastibacterium crithidii]|nr:MAG: zinc ribbon domain-containing protein [Candidatus Kinetoplastibacterium crithidii]